MAIALLYLGCSPSCDGNSKAANYARALTPQRLAKLHADMERQAQDANTPIGGYYVPGKETVLPEAFHDIRAAWIRPRENNIMLEGCFDNYIYLGFQGYGESVGNRAITLIYPDGKGLYTQTSEVLWKEAPAPAAAP